MPSAVGDQPRERPLQADYFQPRLQEGAQAAPVPVVDVLWVVAEPRNVFATQQASGPEPGFVRHRDHDVPARDACELRQRSVRLGKMLQDLEAEDEVEAALGEGQIEDAVRRDFDLRESLRREFDCLRAEIDRSRSRRQRGAEPGQGLALAAASIQQRGGTQRLDDFEKMRVEAIDETAYGRVPGLELSVVGALRRRLDGRQCMSRYEATYTGQLTDWSVSQHRTSLGPKRDSLARSGCTAQLE
jgi:hypothetical protein